MEWAKLCITQCSEFKGPPGRNIPQWRRLTWGYLSVDGFWDLCLSGIIYTGRLNCLCSAGISCSTKHLHLREPLVLLCRVFKEGAVRDGWNLAHPAWQLSNSSESRAGSKRMFGHINVTTWPVNKKMENTTLSTLERKCIHLCLCCSYGTFMQQDFHILN